MPRSGSNSQDFEPETLNEETLRDLKKRAFIEMLKTLGTGIGIVVCFCSLILIFLVLVTYQPWLAVSFIFLILLVAGGVTVYRDFLDSMVREKIREKRYAELWGKEPK